MTPTIQESIFYERCWRCRCVVPNGLVQRRTVNTGHSLGAARCDHYEEVSLCGICAQQFEDEARALGQERGRTWGFLLGLFVLTVAGLPFPMSLLIMCVLAWGIHRRNKRQLVMRGTR